MLARSLEVEKTRFSAPSEVRQAPRFYNQTRTLKFDNLIYRILEATTRIHIFDSVKYVDVFSQSVCITTKKEYRYKAIANTLCFLLSYP